MWAIVLLWMNGKCGLYMYTILYILATSSNLWFHAHNWPMWSDDQPRLLQPDGSFDALPASMRACELTDMSLSFLCELNIVGAMWREKFGQLLALAQKLSPRLQNELEERIPLAYGKSAEECTKHLVSYEMLSFSLSHLSEPLRILPKACR